MPGPLGIVQLSPPSEKAELPVPTKKKKEVVLMNKRTNDPLQQTCLDLEDDYFDEELSQAGVFSQVGISKYNNPTPSSITQANTLRVN